MTSPVIRGIIAHCTYLAVRVSTIERAEMSDNQNHTEDFAKDDSIPSLHGRVLSYVVIFAVFFVIFYRFFQKYHLNWMQSFFGKLSCVCI